MNIEPKSRHSDLTQTFKFIRKLQRKKKIQPTDFYDLIQLIDFNHISIFSSLSKFFILIRNELIYAMHEWKQLSQIYPSSEERNLIANLVIPFSQYFHEELKVAKQVYSDLYECMQRKFEFYQSNSLPKLHIQAQTQEPYGRTINGHVEQINSRALQFIYPEAYSLYTSLKDFITFFLIPIFPLNLQQGLQKQKNFYNMIKKKFGEPHAFTKPTQFLGPKGKFQDQEFYNIAGFDEKMKHQVVILSKNGPYSKPSPSYSSNDQTSIPNQQLLRYHRLLKFVPIQCIGCATTLIKGRPIVRDRSSLTKIQTIKSVTDSKDKLKQLIEGFMNSQNGGVILFDCDDFLFEVHPKGFETNLKVFEHKKQSIMDTIKNHFEDFQVDRDFTIDFVILHDENGNPIIQSEDESTGVTNTSFFITRLKIFSRKWTSELRVWQHLKSKLNKEGKENKEQRRELKEKLANQVLSFDMDTIDYEEMKMRFYKSENVLGRLKEKGFENKVRRAFYGSERKMDELVKGRVGPLFLHESNHCKTSDTVLIRSYGRGSESRASWQEGQ